MMLLRWLRAVVLWIRRLFGRGRTEAPAFAPAPPLGLPPLTPDPLTPLDSRERVAVHEAGHAVVAWHASSVSTLTISVHGDGGHVLCSHFDLASPKVHWLRTVILLGGIAAELDAYGRFRSGHSRQDLLQARSLIETLTAVGFSRPRAPCRLNFRAMFREPLCRDELLLFEAAFQEARVLVSARRTELLRLAALLLVTDFVTEKQAEPILGSRFHVAFLGRMGLRQFLGHDLPTDRESPVPPPRTP